MVLSKKANEAKCSETTAASLDLRNCCFNRQGETVNHLALVTTRPFLIDSDNIDPKVPFFLVYFFAATSGVTW